MSIGNVEMSSKLAEAIAKMYRHSDRFIGEALSRCASPIESMYLVAMASVCHDQDGVYFGDYGITKYEQSDISWKLNPFESRNVIASCDDGSFVVAQQPTIEVGGRRIRPDFAVVASGYVDSNKAPTIIARIIVELDGHEFHERTKEQARSDKARDRASLLSGWHVIRFTGQEVYESAEECVAETLRVAAQLVERRRVDLNFVGIKPNRLIPNFPRVEGVR